MGKKLAIVQSCYIPWKGYFDLIRGVDEFVLYDDAQFTRRDWRNRNRIKTPKGLQWLTIPVESKGNYEASIKDILISDPQWNLNHWRTLVHSYARAPHFREMADDLESLYHSLNDNALSLVNFKLLKGICRFLSIKTPITWSMDYPTDPDLKKTDRLVEICRKAGANSYLSGPSARSYMEEAKFAHYGIEVDYIDYSGYPEYSQLYPPFEHAVTILDLLLNKGSDALSYMKTP